jgi:hypothetical protein
MKNTDRIERLAALRDELAALLTPEERRIYGDPIESLSDLIEDARLEAGE